MFRAILVLLSFTVFTFQLLLAQKFVVSCPIGADRQLSTDKINLTKIGDFGHPRKARPGIPAYLQFRNDVQLPPCSVMKFI